MKLNYQYSITEEINLDNQIIYKIKDSIYDKILFGKIYKEIKNDWELSQKIEEELRKLKYNEEIFQFFNIEKENMKIFYTLYENINEISKFSKSIQKDISLTTDFSQDSKKDTETHLENINISDKLKDINSLDKVEAINVSKIKTIDDSENDFLKYCKYLENLTVELDNLYEKTMDENWRRLSTFISDLLVLFKSTIDDKYYENLDDKRLDIDDIIFVGDKDDYKQSIYDNLDNIETIYVNRYKKYLKNKYTSCDFKKFKSNPDLRDIEIRLEEIKEFAKSDYDGYLWCELYDKIVIFSKKYPKGNIVKITEMIDFILYYEEDEKLYDKYESSLKNLEKDLENILDKEHEKIIADSEKLTTDLNNIEKKSNFKKFYIFIWFGIIASIFVVLLKSKIDENNKICEDAKSCYIQGEEYKDSNYEKANEYFKIGCHLYGDSSSCNELEKLKIINQ